VSQLFSNSLNKIHNYGTTPQNNGNSTKSKGSLSPVSVQNIAAEQGKQKEEEEKIYDGIMTTKELISYCDEILEAIVSQTVCMPCSIRTLIKIIEKQAKKIVFLLKIKICSSHRRGKK